MDNIKVLINEKELEQRVKALAKQIEHDYKNKKINFICILKGSIFFTIDLAKSINSNVLIDFLRVSSYEDKESKEINLVKGLLPNIKDKDVIIIEDIVDTGKTMNFLIPYLKKQQPHSIKVCTLLDKPSKRTVPFKPDYIGFSIEDHFVLGYGLDYNQNYRNLKYIGYIDNDE